MLALDNSSSTDLKQPRRAEAILLGLTLVWGGTFVIVKTALFGVSSPAFLELRFALATIVLILIFPRKALRLNKRLIRDGLILGGFSFLGFILQTEGLRFTTASNSGFITGTSVVFTPIIQIVLEKRFPKWNHITGIAIVCVGLYFLSGHNFSTLNYGDILTLGCAISWSSCARPSWRGCRSMC